MNGKREIVVANEDNDTVGEVVGNGDGTFQAQQT
jgi:hypothetical protein